MVSVACVMLRGSTERPITVTESTNRLVGREPDRIVTGALDVIADRPAPRVPGVWDGQAGQRIATCD